MYAIYLSTNRDINSKYENHYGYYAGNTYRVQGEYYPVTDMGIEERTKFYKLEKVAKRSAEALLEKCEGVVTYRIEPIK